VTDRAGFSTFTAVMKAFMDERKDYNPNNPQASHYTQGASLVYTHSGLFFSRPC